MPDTSREERLHDAICDMLDFATGFCSNKLTEVERLEKIRAIGYAALEIVEGASA